VPSPAPRASRRAVLGSGAVAGVGLLAVVTGCGTDDSRRTGPTSVEPSAPAVDADSDLVTRVVAQVTSALALAKATGAAFPALRPLTGPFVALHRAHLDELGKSADGGKRHVGGAADTGRERLLRAETELQGRLVDAALAAESGALAQVFASMAAALAQRRAVAA
jgi:hypothetical protein